MVEMQQVATIADVTIREIPPDEREHPKDEYLVASESGTSWTISRGELHGFYLELHALMFHVRS